MARNNERMDAPTFDEVAPEKKEQPSKSALPLPSVDLFSNNNFTECIDIPSEGKFYSKDHPLHKKTYVEIKLMTPKEEELLLNKSLFKNGLALDRLIQSVLTDRTIEVSTLLSGDKNAILIACRINGIGSSYDLKTQCRACGEMNEVSFDLNESKPEAYGFAAASRVGDEGDFVVSLPKTGAEVQCRLLRGLHETNLFEINKMKLKNKLDETPITDLLKEIIVSVNGVIDRGKINAFIQYNIPSLDSRYLRMVYSKMNPGMDTKFVFQCNECNYYNRVDMPMTTDFFWPTIK
jgi:hypothetical protein